MKTISQSQLKSTIIEHLGNGKVMQLATCAEGQPWVCSVYYVADNELNIYWLSLPERRHSQELYVNNKAAITIAFKTDLPVIGVGAEGVVDIVSDEEVVERVMKLYYDKYNSGEQFVERFNEGKNLHNLYRFKPTKFVLFDEVNFPKDKSIDWIPEK